MSFKTKCKTALISRFHLPHPFKRRCKTALIIRILLPHNIAFIEEWIYWHLNIIGIDKIFIFTDERDKNKYIHNHNQFKVKRHTQEYIEELHKHTHEEFAERFATIAAKFENRLFWKRVLDDDIVDVPDTFKKSDTQIVGRMIAWFYDNERKNYDWLAFLDADEYLFVSDDLRTLLEFYGKRGALVYLTNKMFLEYSYSGEKYNTSIYKTYSANQNTPDDKGGYVNPAHHTRKYFAKCRQMRRVGWECHDGPVNGRKIWADFDTLRRNHYRLVPGICPHQFDMFAAIPPSVLEKNPFPIDGIDDSLKIYSDEIEANVQENLYTLPVKDRILD